MLRIYGSVTLTSESTARRLFFSLSGSQNSVYFFHTYLDLMAIKRSIALHTRIYALGVALGNDPVYTAAHGARFLPIYL
jgi:hypothetical protein